MVAIIPWPWYAGTSLWIGFAIAIAVLVLEHAVVVSRVIPPLPHVAIIFAGIQLVFMAWFASYFPPENPAYHLGGRVKIYLAYGAPVWIVYCAGWLVALWGLTFRKSELKEAKHIPMADALFWELDILVYGGIALTLLERFVQFPGLQFAFKLAADLKFVGVVGWILLGRPGWRWRAILVVGVEIVSATRAGMFGELALWGAAMVAVWAHRNPWGKKPVVACILGMVVLLPALEQAKWRLRDKTWLGGDPHDEVLGMNVVMTDRNRPFVWALYVVEGLWQTVTLSLEESVTGGLSARHNHGWIVDAVMQHVPASEPYAQGETCIAAVKSALLPRLLFPDKYLAGGSNFERFTGRTLDNPLTGERLASMNLGFAGEFYANFGYAGGIIASGFYGLLSGLLLRVFWRRARDHPLWWAFYPFIFFFGLKAEEGMGEIVNWVFKASVVAAAVYFTLPNLRAALSSKAATAKVRRSPRGHRRRRAHAHSRENLPPSAARD